MNVVRSFRSAGHVELPEILDCAADTNTHGSVYHFSSYLRFRPAASHTCFQIWRSLASNGIKAPLDSDALRLKVVLGSWESREFGNRAGRAPLCHHRSSLVENAATWLTCPQRRTQSDRSVRQKRQRQTLKQRFLLIQSIRLYGIRLARERHRQLVFAHQVQIHRSTVRSKGHRRLENASLVVRGKSMTPELVRLCGRRTHCMQRQCSEHINPLSCRGVEASAHARRGIPNSICTNRDLERKECSITGAP
jgi:hypothetical protein